MSKTDPELVHVFVSYSHNDADWKKRLDVHLKPLSDRYSLDVWSDDRIRPGSKWRDEIREAVERADVAILLISADFLASDFIRNDELPPLLEAAELEGALILPVLVSPCLFLQMPEIAQFQAVNNPSKSLLSASPAEQEETFLEVAEAILGRAAHGKREVARLAPRTENFLEERAWIELLKIGDWIRDEANDRLIGSGMHAYLLSRHEYGSTPFVLQATLEFSNFDHPEDASGKIGMNAGIVLGWQSEKAHPRYLNVLLTGAGVLIERVGFKGQGGYHDFEHLTALNDLEIGAGEPIELMVTVDAARIEVMNGKRKLVSCERPSGVVGRVGLRPWRSQIDCTGFVVFEQASPPTVSES